MNLRWKIAQYFEIRWWKRYLYKKPVEEYLDWKRQYWWQFMEKVGVEIPKESRVLDAGCGPAGIYMILNDYKVVGLDPLLEEYARNLVHFDPAQYPWVSFVDTPLEAYEPKEPFDVICCLNAINHVDNLEKSLQVLSQSLKPGGLFIISTDAHNYLLLKHIFKLLPGDILHPHQYNLKEYQTIIAETGLAVERTIRLKKGKIFSYEVILGRQNAKTP